MVRKNKFSKALNHIKKDYSLTEAPTNSLSGVYSLNQPGHKLGPVPKNAKVFLPDIDGNYPAGIPGTTGEPFYKRGDGHWTGERDWDTITEPNFSHESAGSSGTDTTGLIAEDGTVLTSLPPNSRSFVLGPLVDGHTYLHGTDAYTNIGYIQKDTRQFVLLARVDGQWESGGYPIPSTAVQYGWGESRVWDGTANGFTAYNASFTLEMAQWFRTEMLERRFVKDVAYFYSGGVSQPPITGGPAAGMYGGSGVGAGGNGSSASGGGAGSGYGSGGDPNIGDPQVDNAGGPEDANLFGINWGSISANLRAALRAGKKIADVLWTAAEVVSFAKTGEIIADLTLNPLVDAAFGFGTADSAGEYNTTLATSLMTTVVTGKNQQIKLSKNARQDLVNSIDIKALEQNLVLSKKPKVSSDNAINPNSNKSDAVLTGSWAAQGGVEVNYNPDDGHFTVTAVKMLRDFGNLDQKNADGKITNFEDIPNPTTDQVKNLFTSKGMEGPLKSFFNMVANADIGGVVGDGVSIKPFAAGYDPEEAADMMYTGLPEITKALYNFAVEGSASNAVHLRNKLIDAGVSQSEIEKAGAGFGGYVYSQESYSGSQLPKEIKKVINKKMDVYLGFATESRIISESRKIQILKEVKKPVVLIEASPKMTKLKGYRPNFKGKFTPQNTPDVTACKQSDGLVDKANARGQTWRTENRYWQGYETTERMNIVYDRMGHGQQAWDAIIEDARQKNGWKNREIQEQLNQIAHEKAMRKIDPDFESPWTLKEMEEPNKDEIDKYMKDPLVKRVRKRLLTQIDYPDKPSKKGYPDEPPEQLGSNGFHAKYGKKAGYYKKLDPVSALAMPTQGDPEIDAEVEKQKKKYVKPNVREEWKSDWRVNISSD